MGVRRPEPLDGRAVATDLLWYAAYGSNMHLERLRYYLAGGQPPGNARRYPGCRDCTMPARIEPVVLPGILYFALESFAWTGGMGFYDALDDGELPARAYLVTAGQFADITRQEMYDEPAADLDLSDVPRHGRVVLGPGRYETLVCAGVLDGHPVLTFTAPWRRAEVALAAPSAAYLRHLAAGLVEAHGWTARQAADYLSTRPGAAGTWSAAAIEALLESSPAV